MVHKTQVFLRVERFLTRLFTSCSCLFIFFFLVTGCGTDPIKVEAILHPYSGPVMTAKNIEVLFSDSGKIQAKLYSVFLEQYETPEQYTEFRHGFRVNIFDSAMHTETSIMANYGKRRDYIRIMEARGNVIVRNEVKKQQLNTEELTWDENKRKIYSSAPVKITTNDKIVFGKGLRSDESFTDYTILHVYGQIMVKKDSI